MRIAATLAGAVLWALLMPPAGAHAESDPAKPRVLVEQESDDPETALITSAPEMIRADKEGAQPMVKKRKKPQFQTRFFSE
ncbi:MAG: hypothetical protein ACYC0C_05870 [Devosia sp.]